MLKPLIAAMSAALIAAPLAASPVKYEFGAKTSPNVTLAPAPHGAFAAGCMAGGSAIAITGPTGADGAPLWQAMRLKRNRYYGLPEILSFIERLSARAQQIGWPGIFVGDISQPRGGPMTSGHRSHQIGLDADFWMRPGEARELTRAERESFGSFSVVRRDQNDVNGAWTAEHGAVLQAAAEDPAVARIFVNPAIKKRLCRDAAGADWLRKIRPWYGHDAHFHVRLSCPPGAAGCIDQAPPPPGDGCDATLDWWFSEEARNPKPDPSKPAKPRRELTLADLPAACETVLETE
ncbi:MAG: penicillin-insensitive murein endopeptidase [Pseudomonadota bacterium]